ncbi:hypothetical protein KKA95_04370 [Patescibacteria group bacterium]|nr:hypothetical protein [Patescibacteria group bacterium]
MSGELNRSLTDQEVTEELCLQIAQELTRTETPVETLTRLTPEQRQMIGDLMNNGDIVLD